MIRFLIKIWRRNKQLIINVSRSPVVFIALGLMIILGFKKSTFEMVRNIYYQRVINKIEKRIKHRPKSTRPIMYNESTSKKPVVWTYWDTGVADAPEIVKLCLRRMEGIKNIELRVLTSNTLENYISFPEHIWTKVTEGKIPKAHFSDLIRTELLFKYGGVWLDATVLINSDVLPAELSRNDFFLYGMRKPASNGNPIYVSSWAISSPVAHPALEITRNALHTYWEKNNRLTEYFLFHMIICAVFNKFPELKPLDLGIFDNSKPHVLQLRFNEMATAEILDELLEYSNIHKLTYKYEGVLPGTILDELLTRKISKNV